MMILITGASGNVGREVLKQTAQTGAKIRAAYQDVGKVNAPSGIEVATVDFGQPETLKVALQGVDRVFLVGPPTARLPSLEQKAVDVIKHSNIQQLVKLSAMGGRDSTFPRQHAESEDYILSTGIPYTFLRPNGFMQNLINYSAGTINAQNAFYGSEGDGKVSHIDVRDIAAVAAKVLTEDGHVGKAYTLTGPESLSNAQIAEILSDLLDRKINFVNLAPEQLKQALLAAGVPEWNANALIDLQRFYREGKAANATQDVEWFLGGKGINYNQFLRDYRAAFEVRQEATR
jgi:uncharacterized protein YbjT (DUF2867 family)